MNIKELFQDAIDKKASDIHLSTGEVPRFRIGGELVRASETELDGDSLAKLLEEALAPEAWARLQAGIPIDRSIAFADKNFALTAFRSSDSGLTATFRIIISEIPGLAQIGEGAEEFWQSIVDARRGLVLITGPAMSGKNTTSCAIVEAINSTRPNRIFVVYETPSYQFKSKTAMITQIVVGSTFDTMERALETAHNCDPDVILVNDIPTAEALRQVMLLADTGHLVIANLHATSVVDALNRLSYGARGDERALHQSLAQNLLALTVQRLFVRLDRTGRVPAYEWLRNSQAVAQALSKSDLHGVAELQRTEPGSQSLDVALDQLVAAGKISEEMAAPHRAG